MSSPVYQICESLELSLLVENTARGAGILGEHGLSWCLRHSGRQVLFDLGQGMALRKNSEQMGVDLSATDALVFSHGHYDHVRGWHQVAEDLAGTAVFMHPDALDDKFQKRPDGSMVSAGDVHFARSMSSTSVRVSKSAQPLEVVPGIWMTGQVPRKHEIEDTGGDFYCDSEGCLKDALLDDQSLFFRTNSGVVVVLGCAHSGVVNTLDHVCYLTGERIHAVVGGMHLLNADEARIGFTLDGLRRIGPDWLSPNHCTGDAAVARLWQSFPGQVLEMHAGQSITFPKSISESKDNYHA